MVTSKTFSYRVTTFIIYFILLLAAFISLAPLINTVAISFSSSGAANAGKVGFIPVDFTLGAYKKIMNDQAFWRAFGVSLQRVFLGGIINLTLVVLMAFPLSRTTKQFRYRNLYMWTLMFTMLFNGGIIPTYMVVTKMGLINTIWSLILPGAVSVYNVILMMNFFRNIPSSLEEAALMDGASPWTVLFKIFLPISLPSLATITLFVIVGHWNNFFDGLIYINDQTKIPLQTYLQQLSLSTEAMKEATAEEMKSLKDLSSLTLNSAKILVSMIPILIIYPLLQRFLISGLVLGSVKE
ncbi:carbohydrate ABC transporter permease [Enterococcus sp. LJL98]